VEQLVDDAARQRLDVGARRVVELGESWPEAFELAAANVVAHLSQRDHERTACRASRALR